MPSGPDGKISRNSRSPNVKRKKCSRAKHWLNQSQEAKLLQSERHKGYRCLILVPNLSRCVGKWFIYIYTHAISDTHLTKHTITPTCKAALLYCVPVAGTERTDFCKMLKDPSTVAGTEQQTWKGLRLSTPPSKQMGHPHVSKHTQSRRAKFSFPVSLTSSEEGRQDSSQPPQKLTEGSTAKSPIMPASPALHAAIGQGHQPLGHRRDATPRAGSRKRNAALGHSCKFSCCVTKPCCSAEQLQQFGNCRRNLRSHSTAPDHRWANVKGLKTLAWVVFYARIVCCYFYTTCLAKDT